MGGTGRLGDAPRNPASSHWVILLCNSPFLRVGSTCDVLCLFSSIIVDIQYDFVLVSGAGLGGRIEQRQWDVTLLIQFCRVVVSMSPADSLWCRLHLHTLVKLVAGLERPAWPGTEGTASQQAAT